MTFQFIQQQHDFDHVLALMSQQQCYGLDTEFIKVDSLWPKLGVFQINVAQQIYLLDGTSLDFSKFWQLLFQAQQNIFHACSEDIDLIYHYAQRRPLANVFDTQVALSFLGYGLQVSYQNALKHVLDIEIDKDQTRSDWLARPLTEQQLNYASNDVLYLMRLAEHLKQQLSEKDQLSYVLEDCQHMTCEIANITPIEQLYQDVGNYRHSRRQLMQIQQLSAWREQLAHQYNLPRSFILKNNVILELVEEYPKTAAQLIQIKNIRMSVVREHSKTILNLLKQLPEPTLWPERLPRPMRLSAQMATDVDDLLQAVSQTTGIAKEVLMRKKWLNALIFASKQDQPQQHLPAYLLGWRYALLTEPLLKLLQQGCRTD